MEICERDQREVIYLYMKICKREQREVKTKTVRDENKNCAMLVNTANSVFIARSRL